MKIEELKPDIQINSFYYSETLNWFVFVVALREDWVYYNFPNLFDVGTQHMKIEEFCNKFERVDFLVK